MLISLDQSKAFDRVDHRFLVSVLETAGFKPEFHRWMSMMYHNPQAVVQVNGRCAGVIAIERSVRQGWPLSPLLYVLALEPLLRRLRDEGTSPALRGIPFAGRLAASVFAFADEITVFVSRRLDIEAVKEVVVEYERIAGAKVNFDKSEGFRLGAWRGSNTLPGPFRWSDGPIRILEVWFGPDLQLKRNWPEVHAKVNAQVGICLSRRLSLKGRVEACAEFAFPLIIYWLAVFLCLRNISWRFNDPSPDCSGEVQGRWSVGRSVSNVLATGVWVCLILRATGLLKDLHIWAESWRGTQYGDNRWVGHFLASSQTQWLKVDVGLWAKHCLSASAERPFVTFLGPVTFHGLGRELYRELVVGSASDRLSEQHGWTAEEIHSYWNWASGSSFLKNSEFSLTWWLARISLPLRDLNYKPGLADTPDWPRCSSGMEETAEHAFYYCERVRPFWDHIGEWTATIEPKKLVLLDVGYVVDNVLPPFHGEKRVVFLVILAVARMVIWTTRNKGLYDDAIFFHSDLVFYFRHQLKVKIRWDRKRLDRITFSKRWVTAASLVVKKGAMLESSFPPLLAHGVYCTGP